MQLVIQRIQFDTVPKSNILQSRRLLPKLFAFSRSAPKARQSLPITYIAIHIRHHFTTSFRPIMTDSSSNTKVDSYQGVLQRYKVPQGPSLPMFLNGDLKSDKAVSPNRAGRDQVKLIPFLSPLYDISL